MERLGKALCSLILCAVLAPAPVLAHTSTVDGAGPLESTPPAEVDEQYSDPKIEERNHDKAHRGSSSFSFAVKDPRPHGAALCSLLAPARGARRDDPRGFLANGLRAPPA